METVFGLLVPIITSISLIATILAMFQIIRHGKQLAENERLFTKVDISQLREKAGAVKLASEAQKELVDLIPRFRSLSEQQEETVRQLIRMQKRTSSAVEKDQIDNIIKLMRSMNTQVKNTIMMAQEKVISDVMSSSNQSSLFVESRQDENTHG